MDRYRIAWIKDRTDPLTPAYRAIKGIPNNAYRIEIKRLATLPYPLLGRNDADRLSDTTSEDLSD